MIKPFIKWAGSKSSIVKVLINKSHYAKDYNYYEPFIGGGALFFKIANVFKLSTSIKIRCNKFYISDSNSELITTYKVVRNNPDELMQFLDIHKNNHSEEYYYYIRSIVPNSYIETAARFIYLNKTCFYGLYRVNKKGVFNVPFGKYKNSTLYDKSNLLKCSELLQNVDIKLKDFENIYPKKGDFVYFDPPYHKLVSTSFTAYTNNYFTIYDHIRLANKCKLLNEQGVHFMLSNSNTDFIRDLYKDFHIEEIAVARNINCKGEGRAKIKELIIRNYN